MRTKPIGGRHLRQRGDRMQVRGPLNPPERVTPEPNNTNVASAGQTAVNGVYVWVDDTWVKSVYIIDKSPDWKIRNGPITYYTAPATDMPWEATWGIGPDGYAPSPTVTEVL